MSVALPGSAHGMSRGSSAASDEAVATGPAARLIEEEVRRVGGGSSPR